MKSIITVTVLILLSALASGVSGQTTLRLAFSTDGAEVASSGAGGTVSAPGNSTAIFRDEAILLAFPAASGTPSATFLANRGTWPALLGDDNADGNYILTTIGNLDALQLVAGAPNPPSLFDYYMSFSQDIGPSAAQLGTPILDGDIVRLLPGGGVFKFITEAQIASAMGTTAATLDINGFAIHSATGDLYWTTTTTQLVNGISLDDGGLIRLPASGYTLGANGAVASVVPGAGQIALFESSLDAMSNLAGLGAIGDLDGVTIDPAGGTFVGPTGLVLPHFWFTADGLTFGPRILSTRSGGSVATYNGTNFSAAVALGLAPVDFQGGANSTLTALDASLVGAAVLPPPVIQHLSGTMTTPGVAKIDFGSCTPNAPFYLLGKIAQTSALGGYTSRTPLIPSFATLNNPGSFPALYMNDFMDPVFLLAFSLPPAIASPQGLGSFQLPVPPISAGLGICFQGIDAARGAITPPIVLVFQ
jgi:hypothetical protein